MRIHVENLYPQSQVAVAHFILASLQVVTCSSASVYAYSETFDK